MQILKVNGASSSLNFKSDKNLSDGISDERYMAAKEFAGYSDAQLMNMATYKPQEDYKKTAKSLVRTMFVAVPAIDILATGLMKNGNLSGKMLSSAKQAGRWAGILGVGAVLLGVKQAVNNSVPELKEMDKRNPVLAFALDFAALLGGFGALVGLKNVTAKFAKNNYPETIAKMRKEFVEPLKKAINNTKLNKEIILPVEKYIAGSKGLSKGLGILAVGLAPVVACAAILKGFSELKNKHEEINENFIILKETQELFKDELSLLGETDF